MATFESYLKRKARNVHCFARAAATPDVARRHFLRTLNSRALSGSRVSPRSSPFHPAHAGWPFSSAPPRETTGREEYQLFQYRSLNHRSERSEL
jgi:hypothetical protein